MSREQIFPFKGTIEEYSEYPGSPVGESKVVYLRETPKFWFDEAGDRYSKDTGVGKKGNPWVLYVDSIEVAPRIRWELDPGTMDMKGRVRDGVFDGKVLFEIYSDVCGPSDKGEEFWTLVYVCMKKDMDGAYPNSVFGTMEQAQEIAEEILLFFEDGREV
jgi:hypothetical protein